MTDGPGGRRLGRGLKALISVPEEAPSGGELVRIALSRADSVGTKTGWRPAMPVTQWVWTKP